VTQFTWTAGMGLHMTGEGMGLRMMGTSEGRFGSDGDGRGWVLVSVLVQTSNRDDDTVERDTASTSSPATTVSGLPAGATCRLCARSCRVDTRVSVRLMLTPLNCNRVRLSTVLHPNEHDVATS